MLLTPVAAAGTLPLSALCTRGLNQVAGVFIAGGADVDASDLTNSTPLHVAVHHSVDESRYVVHHE